MFKFLLITFLIGYLLFKVGGYIFRALFWTLGSKMNNTQFNNKPPNMRPPNSNVDIDYMPKNGKAKKTKEFKGGEYVDYEEIE